eukprot:8053164-Pyramimonas_sp.AAC.1
MFGVAWARQRDDMRVHLGLRQAGRAPVRHGERRNLGHVLEGRVLVALRGGGVGVVGRGDALWDVFGDVEVA